MEITTESANGKEVEEFVAKLFKVRFLVAMVSQPLIISSAYSGCQTGRTSWSSTEISNSSTEPFARVNLCAIRRGQSTDRNQRLCALSKYAGANIRVNRQAPR